MKKQQPKSTAAKAAGQLADQSKRLAEKAEALGFTEQARDHRNRQANMIGDLQDAANAENRNQHH